MMMEPTTEDSDRQIEGIWKHLNKLYTEISDDRLRIELFRELLSKDLATWDIFHFVEGQAGLRSVVKTLDTKTMTAAMRMKLLDIKKTLASRVTFSQELEKEAGLTQRDIKELKDNYKKKNSQRIGDKRNKYRLKVNHYLKKQNKRKEILEHEKKEFRCSKVPENMQEFKDISIFKTPKDLPEPCPPLGPFICATTVNLNEDEKKILSKDPKYSLIRKIERMNFLLELEKMLSKHRYNRIDLPDKNKLKII